MFGLNSNAKIVYALGPVASHPPAVLVIEKVTMTPRRRGAPCSAVRLGCVTQLEEIS